MTNKKKQVLTKKEADALIASYSKPKQSFYFVVGLVTTILGLGLFSWVVLLLLAITKWALGMVF